MRAQADAKSPAAAARSPARPSRRSWRRRRIVGRTLFRLLVPIEMEPFLAGTTDMQIEVDGGTAGIAWELLDSDTPGGGPIATVGDPGKVVAQAAHRRFSRPTWPTRLRMRARWSLANPPATRSSIRGLPGARDEALAVAECLGARRPRGRSSHSPS